MAFLLTAASTHFSSLQRPTPLDYSSVRFSPFLDSLKIPLWTFAEHMNVQFSSGGCIRRLRSCGILISESGVYIGIG